MGRGEGREGVGIGGEGRGTGRSGDRDERIIGVMKLVLIHHTHF